MEEEVEEEGCSEEEEVAGQNDFFGPSTLFTV